MMGWLYAPSSSWQSSGHFVPAVTQGYLGASSPLTRAFNLITHCFWTSTKRISLTMLEVLYRIVQQYLRKWIGYKRDWCNKIGVLDLPENLIDRDPNKRGMQRSYIIRMASDLSTGFAVLSCLKQNNFVLQRRNAVCQWPKTIVTSLYSGSAFRPYWKQWHKADSATLSLKCFNCCLELSRLFFCYFCPTRCKETFQTLRFQWLHKETSIDQDSEASFWMQQWSNSTLFEGLSYKTQETPSPSSVKLPFSISTISVPPHTSKALFKPLEIS